MVVSGSFWDLVQPVDPPSRPRREPPFYRIKDVRQFKLDRFAAVDNLKLGWLDLELNGGQAPGNSGLSFRDYSPSEMFSVLRAVSRSLVDQTYRPHPVRIHKIKKPNGKFRELSIQEIPDRVVAKCLQVCLDRFWRPRIPSIGRSPLDLFVRLNRNIRERQIFGLQIDDIRDCFPSARQALVIASQTQFIQQPELQWLVTQIIRGHEGRENPTGIGQGSPYSPVAMEVFLHTSFDAALERAHRGDSILYRYVDNICVQVRDENRGKQVIDAMSDIVSGIGFDLKREDGFIDLRDENHNTKLLGLIPRWKGALSFDIPSKTFDQLNEKLTNATQSDYPERTAHRVIEGWIRALGPALTNAARNDVISRVLTIARNQGFSGLGHDNLLEIAKIARKAWMEMNQ